MKSQDDILFKGERVVTPSVLHPKSFAKTCHEHHIYVLMHVIKCETKVDSIVMLYHLGFKTNFY